MHRIFSLQDNILYKVWRDQKLATYPTTVEKLFTDILNPQQPDALEINNLLQTAAQYNLAFYRFPASHSPNKTSVHTLSSLCGLRNIDQNLCSGADHLTSIQVAQHQGQHSYIPYTNRRLNWHTDGYYNAPEQQINGMLLHCVRPADQGGGNLFLDHEIAYILLRETDPAYITALMHPQAFTIPANILNNKVIRPEQSGPVFYLTTDGRLQMRYSARQRNVKWRNDAVTRKAEQFLLDLWQEDSSYKLCYTLQAGEGLLSNNILHCRTEFSDHDASKQSRLLYRGRYLERLSLTSHGKS